MAEALPKDTHPRDDRYPMGSRYDRRRCDYCFRWVGVNVRRQHYRVCPAKARAEKDAKLGVLPLGKAKCDSCSDLAYTRWYTNHGTKHERVAHTVCKKHEDEMLAESAANRARLGLDGRQSPQVSERQADKAEGPGR